LRDKFHPEILTGSPEWERQTRVKWGKQAMFLDFSVNVLIPIRDTPKVTINDY